MLPVLLEESTSTYDTSSFKHFLLSIVLAVTFVEEYNQKKKTNKPIGAISDESENKLLKRNISTLRDLVSDYNKYIRRPITGNAPRQKGGSNKIYELSKVYESYITSLIYIINEIEAPISSKLYQKTVIVLKGYVPRDADAEKTKRSNIDFINSFVFCQYLIEETFPYFDEFYYNLLSISAKTYSSIKEFIYSEEKLDSCSVTFVNISPRSIKTLPPPLLPTKSEIRSRVDLFANKETEQQALSVASLSKKEYYPELKYFISYSHEDSNFVLKLAEELREAKASLWLDQLDIAPGQRLDRSIEKALHDCGGMLIVLSPESVISENVRDEILFALDEKKTIIPVLILPCSIPYRLRNLQYIDFIRNYETAFARLLKVLKPTDTPSRHEHPVGPDPLYTLTKEKMQSNPLAFISYAWESEEAKNWVKYLATQLRNEGIDAKIDQWEVIPGDQLPHFMEKSVRENDYVLIVCTPKYKTKSENRVGGVGYEGDIMTAEVLRTANHRKFIPVLKAGSPEAAIPTWLQGKYFVDLSSDKHFQENFEDLVTTLLNAREKAPALGVIRDKYVKVAKSNKSENSTVEDEDVKIKGILIDEVSQPLNDGTRGSALYKIPFELNKAPDYEWTELFINAWDRPSTFTQMHRSGIASVEGNKIILDGTEIEEVEKYHKDTLKLAVKAANEGLKEIKRRRRQKEELEKQKLEAHRNRLNDIGGRINFDD